MSENEAALPALKKRGYKVWIETDNRCFKFALIDTSPCGALRRALHPAGMVGAASPTKISIEIIKEEFIE